MKLNKLVPAIALGTLLLAGCGQEENARCNGNKYHSSRCVPRQDQRRWREMVVGPKSGREEAIRPAGRSYPKEISRSKS